MNKKERAAQARNAELNRIAEEQAERRRKRGYLTQSEINSMYARMRTAAVPVPARAMAAGGGTSVTAVPTLPGRAATDPGPQAPEPAGPSSRSS
jgi:hypothetical protein